MPPLLKSENKRLNSNASKSKHHLELPRAGAQLGITTLVKPAGAENSQQSGKFLTYTVGKMI